MYRAFYSHTSASGYSWRAGTRSAASHSTSYASLSCRLELLNYPAVQRNPECARISRRRLSRKSVAAAKVGWDGIGSRWESSRLTSESNGQGPQGESSLQSKADNDNWLVISHCVIQWNTIERGRKMPRWLRLVAALLRRVLIDPAAGLSAKSAFSNQLLEQRVRPVFLAERLVQIF